MSNFNRIHWKSKDDLAREKLEAEILELKKKIADLEKKMMGRIFVRNAGLQEVQRTKKELLTARKDLAKAEKKLDDLAGTRK